MDDTPEGKRQEMLGFGHAWTDSTVSTFGSLEDSVLDKLMAELFGPQGNNMGFMRHTSVFDPNVYFPGYFLSITLVLKRLLSATKSDVTCQSRD